MMQGFDTTKWMVMSEMSREEIIASGAYLARTIMDALNTTHSILQRNQIPIETEHPEELLEGEDKQILLDAAKNVAWAEEWIEKFKVHAIERDLTSKFENALKGVKV